MEALELINNFYLEKRKEEKARRAAKKVGLQARKSRWRSGTIDNQGGFQLINPYTNRVVNGSRFDLSADEVIKICAELAS
jgi:hypothetical protein